MIQRLASVFRTRPTTAEGWLARMGRPGVGASDQAAFLAWLEADDANLARYEAAKADLAALGAMRGAFEGDLARLGRGRRAPATRRLAVLGGLAAAGAAAIFVLVPMLSPSGVETRIYQSAPGQILDVVLADGSRVTLDAGSSISVALASDARRVVLQKGAAYFDVAHDQAHPFQVAVGDRRVVVTGTRFTTSLFDGRGEVSLLEGRVAIGTRDVRARDALAQAVKLAPGDRARFEPGRAGERVERADVEIGSAWRRRKLVFRDAPLSEVVAAASRYAGRPLGFADPRLAEMRVTVVLPLTGEDDLVGRMDRLLPIRIDTAPDGRGIIRAE